jgi:OmcA/MtrC family decaheme c-type cytochrome
MHASKLKKLAVVLGAATLALSGCSGEDGDRGPEGPTGPTGPGAPTPPGAGLEINILSATVPATGRPTVTIEVTDAQGTPVDFLAELLAGRFGTTRGPRYTVSARQTDGTYKSLYESGTPLAASNYPASGTTLAAAAAMYTEIELGTYTFTWPADPTYAPDVNAVHTVGVWATRTFEDVGYPKSTTFHFTPATGAAAPAREVVTDAACNACHKNLSAHGSRRTVGLCLTCHYPGWTDADGENIDFRSMIHKIHAATYQLVEDGQVEADFTGVVFPDLLNGVKNCAMCHGGAPQAAVPSIAACSSCHTGLSPTHGGAAACTACHDDGTAPSVATAHSFLRDGETDLTLAGQTMDIVIDSVDANTTAPTVTFTISLDGAPATLTRTSLCKLPAEATLVSCGQLRFSVAGPTSDFGSGAVNPAANGSSYGYLQSPNFFEGDANYALLVATATPGQYTAPLVTATSLTTFQAIAAGTSIAVGAEAYTFEAVATATGGCGTGALASSPSQSATCAVREWAQSPTAIEFAAVGGGTVVSRRLVTDNAKCNACHYDLGFHGGEARKTPEYCAFCHHPNNVNDERTTRLEFFENPPGTPTTDVYTFTPESVSIMMMAHKIHAGSALSTTYVLGADRSLSAAAPYADTVTFAGAFPGDLGDCQTCHRPGTYGLPDPGNLPVLVATYACNANKSPPDADNFCDTLARWPQEDVATAGADTWTVTDWFTVPPQAAACTSCHDSDAAKAHASLNTTVTGVESCAVCHGDGSTWDALEVHQPAP